MKCKIGGLPRCRKTKEKALQLESFAVDPNNHYARAKFQINDRSEKQSA
jgi:hypothetical protein